MDKKLVKAFNEQIKNELYSAYLYLSMAAWCESQNLEGFAHWMKIQTKEENGHAMKLFEFLNDNFGNTFDYSEILSIYENLDQIIDDLVSREAVNRIENNKIEILKKIIYISGFQTIWEGVNE